MTEMNQKSKNIRLNILKLANKSQKVGAHISPSLSVVEILSAVFCKKFDKDYDRFVLSKGHAGLALYSAMHESGIITSDNLDSFEDNGGEYPGQPTRTSSNKISFASGTLGIGLSYAAGLAYAKKTKNEKGLIYVLLGNGEMNEGTNYESLMFIKHHNLDNIVIIIDDNHMQSDGNTDNILSIDIKNICNGFGFNIINCDGHNENDIVNAIDQSIGNCSVIIANTVKGKGVSFMENNNEWHHNNLKDDKYQLAIDEVLNA